MRKSVGCSSSTATTVRPSADMAMPASARGAVAWRSSFRFGTSREVDDAQEMAGIGIATMNAVAEYRHVGEAALRYDEQFVHRAGKIVEHDLRLVARGIEKQDFRPHFVDRDHPARAARIIHR